MKLTILKNLSSHVMWSHSPEKLFRSADQFVSISLLFHSHLVLLSALHLIITYPKKSFIKFNYC